MRSRKILPLFFLFSFIPALFYAKSDLTPDIHVTWYGQACFSIHSKTGTHVMTDPFDESLGYPLPNVSPDVVTVSHEHPDHNAVDKVPRRPVVVRTVGETGAGGLVFHGIGSWHDDNQGRTYGPNTIFVWQMSGLRLAHLGDLGQSHLTADQRSALRHVDVLFIPVGGVFTINAAQALDIIDEIKPAMVIPMHYKTPALKINLEAVDPFLKGPFPVVKTGTSDILVNHASLPSKTTIFVMDYVH